MSPTANFNAVLAATTVGIMYFVLPFLLPLVNAESRAYQFLLPLASFLGSLGIYRLLAIGLRFAMNRWEYLRKKILGAHYVHGTWVGWFVGHSGEVRYMVEHFEQSLDSFVIRGWSFKTDNKTHGSWHSRSTALNVEAGTLEFSYVFDSSAWASPRYGLNQSLLQRKSKGAAAFALKGIAHDLNDETRIDVHSEKVSDSLVPPLSVLNNAHTRFAEEIKFIATSR